VLAVRDAIRFRHAVDRSSGYVGIRLTRTRYLNGAATAAHSIKQYDGLSAFARDESEYDTLRGGHAIDLALARRSDGRRARQKGRISRLRAIGDSSLAGGMAKEALTQAGIVKSRLIGLLHDNEMSIARRSRRAERYLNRIKRSAELPALKKRSATRSKACRFRHSLRRMPQKLQRRDRGAVLPRALVKSWAQIHRQASTVCTTSRNWCARSEESEKGRTTPVIVIHRADDARQGFFRTGEKIITRNTRPAFRPENRSCRTNPTKTAPRRHTRVIGDDVRIGWKTQIDRRPDGALADGTGVVKILEKFPDEP
jgi:hypothetical protein